VIAGDGVADGYLGEPEMTAQRFVAEPFHAGGGRMYRTGDLGSWRDGVLYFHGRVDHQIKIRGFRIEPGDIEAAAGADPAVRECVVVARRFGDNDLRLVLYAAVDGDPVEAAARLRRELRERLPVYMVPQHIEVLVQLPKTANGKIDRKVLPPPVAASHDETASSAPETVLDDPRQAYLAGLWRELIGVPSVRASDNFFDVGGHSLLAVAFTTRVQRELGVRLNLLDVATSTLAALASSLPAPEAAPTPVAEADAAGGSLWSRLFGRRRAGDRAAGSPCSICMGCSGCARWRCCTPSPAIRCGCWRRRAGARDRCVAATGRPPSRRSSRCMTARRRSRRGWPISPRWTTRPACWRSWWSATVARTTRRRVAAVAVTSACR
jgi:hypothetical protein